MDLDWFWPLIIGGIAALFGVSRWRARSGPTRLEVDEAKRNALEALQGAHDAGASANNEPIKETAAELGDLDSGELVDDHMRRHRERLARRGPSGSRGPN